MTMESRAERRITSFRFRKVRWHRICILFAVVLLAGTLPFRFPAANAIPSSATSCVSTECALSPKVSSSLPSGLGEIASEVKFDQSVGYSDGQTTAYGGNNPNIWIGLGASLNNNARSIQNPLYNFRVLQITVAITDSSGNQFPLNSNTITTSVWDAPYPSGITIDYAQLIGELSNFLVGLLGVPTPPNIPISQPTPNGNYIVSNTLITQWTGYPNPCYIDSSFHNTCGAGGGGALYDKFLRVKIVPTFTIPDAYKITIGTQVERGACYQKVSSNDHVLSYYDYCYTQEKQTQSYSFSYVYENDAGQGTGDAADSLPNAGGSVFTLPSHGSYAGFLYGIDTADLYGFAASQGEKVSFTVTPPATADFGLTLYDVNYQTIQTRQDNGVGATNGLAFTASIGGTYFASISWTSGWGTYSFTLSDSFAISANPGNVNLGLAGTASSTPSTVTVASPGDFAGRVDLATSVSPNVPNGPTASLSNTSVYGSAACNTVISTSGQVSNPSYAFVQDGNSALFTVPSTTTPATAAYGFATPSLPPGATITSVRLIALQRSSGSPWINGPYAIVTIPGVAQTSGGLMQGSLFAFNWGRLNVTSMISNWTPSLVGQIQVTISATVSQNYSQPGTVEIDVMYLEVIYATSSVTLTAGSSDTRVLTVSSTTSTPAGIYTVSVTGTSAGSISFAVPVTAAVQDFQVTASPTSLTIPPGQSAPTTITVSPLNGFTGTVTLSVSAPGGITTGFSTNTISGGAGTSTLTITVTSAPNPDPATITVTGSSGGRTQTATLSVLNPPPTFILSATPNLIIAPAGQSTALTVTVTSLYGFTGTVSLIGQSPPGLSCSAPNPSSVTLTSTTTAAPSTLSCTAPAGLYTLNSTAASGSTATFLLIPFTAQDFSISASPTSICQTTGSQTFSQITVTSMYGFAGTVSLSPSVSPIVSGGPTTSMSSSSINVPSGSSTVSTLWVTAGSATGTFTVTVQATSGSLSHSATDTVTIVSSSCGGGGGGGSVGAGTLIMLADGTQVPVQSLKVGMQLLSYDMTTHQYVITTITRFVTVMTHNQMVISTSTGKPLIVDQNPAQKLYVKTPDGTVTLMSVTDLQIGYDLFDAISQTWVPITSIHYENGGNHLMYDLYTTSPGNYIANGYLDPLKM